MGDTDLNSRIPRVDADVARARTLPGWVHGDPDFFELTRRRVLRGAWGFVGPKGLVAQPNRVLPTEIIEGASSEPIVLTRADDGVLRALSNVCTHRANLVQSKSASCTEMRCGYHGRRFDLDGKLRASPGFEGAQDLPSAMDNLPQIPCGEVGPAVFASLEPGLALEQWSAPIAKRLGHLAWNDLQPFPERDRDFEIDASWILYVENFLEGMHVPFVHPGLASAIDLAGYTHEMLPWGTLQVAEARGKEAALRSSPLDGGRRVAAHYLWLFPTTMLNLYPWGLSLNVVEPLGVQRTRIRFRSFVWDRTLLDQGAGADLWQVELEDEDVVQACQRGNTARLYQSGRYAPLHERGLHRFHRLLLEVIRDGWQGADQRA